MHTAIAKSQRSRGVSERYREFLPVSASTPIVSLGEGNTPLIYCQQLSKRVGRGCRVFVKNEGVNPTGSFKDRGMTVAVSKSLERGAKAIICASTGNTSAAAAAYAARAGISCVVILPAGKIATSKLLQAVGAAPIFHNRVIEKPETMASAIRIGNPASWKQARAAIAESHGAIDVVSDGEIIAAQTWLARYEGIFVEPASAAAIAGLFKCCDSNEAAYSFKKIPEQSRIVCTVTGHGLKDPDIIMQRMRELKPVPATVNDVQRAIDL